MFSVSPSSFVAVLLNFNKPFTDITQKDPHHTPQNLRERVTIICVAKRSATLGITHTQC